MYRIKELAKERHMTLKDLGHHIDVAPNTLSRIISGENTTIEMLQKIAGFLNVELRELFVSNETTGFIEHLGTVHRIKSLADLERLVESIKNNG
ncbi:helix-turn-helix domain-containing protein [Ulvibacterium sp.]|uniref:helix-turn-helix domain-containing protein n=1 Tax=Ulvibacterium sp. TaxID=2665914 RepID=UPI002639202C|nr:helix-turn-helix transcriptional regulator [Ulvibacterium sp.]